MADRFAELRAALAIADRYNAPLVHVDRDQLGRLVMAYDRLVARVRAGESTALLLDATAGLDEEVAADGH